MARASAVVTVELADGAASIRVHRGLVRPKERKADSEAAKIAGVSAGAWPVNPKPTRSEALLWRLAAHGTMALQSVVAASSPRLWMHRQDYEPTIWSLRRRRGVVCLQASACRHERSLPMTETKAPAAALKQRGATMRLTLSAGVANDLNALGKGLKDLAERLGHPNCATGCNQFHLLVERDFVAVRDKSAVMLNPQPLPPLRPDLPQDPQPTVRVSMPGAMFDDIGTLRTVIERVLGRLGCPACCSGFDILFQRELDGFVIDQKLGLHGTGRFT